MKICLPAKLRFKVWNLPDIGGTPNVWIEANIIGVNMVLHSVLVNPIYLWSSYEINGETKYSVYDMVSAEGAMICIMLNVKTCFKMSTYYKEISLLNLNSPMRAIWKPIKMLRGNE